MISSTMPSAKYSCSGSPLILARFREDQEQLVPEADRFVDRIQSWHRWADHAARTSTERLCSANRRRTLVRTRFAAGASEIRTLGPPLSRSPKPCRHRGAAPHPRGADPRARRQALCDSDRDGPGPCDSLSPGSEKRRRIRKLVRRAVLTKNTVALRYGFCTGHRRFESSLLHQRVVQTLFHVTGPRPPHASR
jgi:hypothetical protein